MTLWYSPSRVALPAPGQGCVGWFVEGKQFVCPARQPKPPATLAEEKRGREGTTSGFPRLHRALAQSKPWEILIPAAGSAVGGLLSNTQDKGLPGKKPSLCLAGGNRVLRMPSQCKYHSQPGRAISPQEQLGAGAAKPRSSTEH